MNDKEKGKTVLYNAANRGIIEFLKSIPGLAFIGGWIEGMKDGADKVVEEQREDVARVLRHANHEDTRYAVQETMKAGVQDIISAIPDALNATALAVQSDFERVIGKAEERLKQRDFSAARALLDEARERYWTRISDDRKVDFVCIYGNTYLQDSSFEAAAEWYLKELPLLSVNKRAKHAYCLAAFLKGETDEAHKLATSLIKEYPDSSRALSLYIQTAPEGQSVGKLVERVHGDASTSDEVLVAIGTRYLDEGRIENAIHFFEMAAAREGKSRFTASLMLLRCKLQSFLVSSPRLPDSPPSDSEKTILESYKTDLLTLLSAAHEEGKAFQGEVNYTLSLVWHFLGNKEEENRAFDLAMLQLPLQGGQVRHLQKLLRQNKKQEASDLAISMGYHGNVEVLFLQLNSLLDAASETKPDFVEGLLKRYLEIDTDPHRKFYILYRVFEVLPGLADHAIAMSAESIKSESPLLASYLGLLQCRANGVSPERESVATLARMDHSGLNDDEFVIALALVSHDSFPDSHSEVLSQALHFSRSLKAQAYFCRMAYRAGCYQAILRKVEALRSENIYSPVLFAHEIHILSVYAPTTALKRATELKSGHPEHVDWLLHELLLGMRLRDDSVSLEKADLLPRVGDVNTETGHLVVQLLRHYRFPHEAVSYAFALHDKHPNDLHANLAVMLSMSPAGPFGQHWGDPFVPVAFNTVQVGAAVRIRHEVTSEITTIYIVPDGEETRRGEILESDPLAKRLLGLAAGQRIAHSSIEGEVIEILDRRVAKFHRIMEEFESSFPSSSALKVLSVPTDKDSGESDLSQLKAMMKKIYRQQELARSVYRKGNIPIQYFANFLGRPTEQAWLGILVDDSMPAFVSYRHTKELNRWRLKGSTVVVDVTALVTLFQMDMMKILLSQEFKAIASENTLIRFLEFLAHIDEHLDVEMNLEATPDGFRPTINNLSADMRESKHMQIDAARAVVKQIESFLPVEMMEFPQEARDRLGDSIDSVTQEGLLHCWNKKIPIWSDEGYLDLINAPVRRVWTGEVLDQVLNGSSLRQEYLKAKSHLIGSRCRLIPVNAEEVLYCAERADFRPHLWPFSQALDIFSDEVFDVDSVKRVAFDFLGEIYLRTNSSYLRDQITNRILGGLARLSGGMFYSYEIKAEMRRRLMRNPAGLHELLDLIDKWVIAYRKPNQRLLLT